MNTLYYGDNLKILREYIKDESVDLIYLDPPFNSNRNYNVLFKDESGIEAPSQITAFEDTWHWHTRDTAETYHQLIKEGDKVSEMLQAFYTFIGQNQMMAYLVMMAARLKELHRVLKPTGSLYLHCDPTASHYLKILLDTIFGGDKFRSEISWKRSSAHNDAKQGRMQPGNIRDVIYFYTKGNAWTWNWLYTPYSQEYIDAFYSYTDFDGRRYRLGDLTAAKPGGDTSYDWRLKRLIGSTKWEVDDNDEYLNPHPKREYQTVKPYRGRYWAYSRENMAKYLAEGRLYFPKNGGTPSYKRYLDEMPGVPLQNDWNDIRPASGKSEYLGYPTQKPVALLERIIQASSNEGDVVLDPFCGCGTTIVAAQKLNRQWIGIDVTHLAIGLMKYRLRDQFGIMPYTGKLSFMPTGLTGEVSLKRKQSEEAPLQQGYRVIGQPEDLAGAKQLWNEDRYGFQWWVLPLIGARALGAEKGSKVGKKGADGGIDGIRVFTDDNSGKAKKVIISVKGGGVNVSQIRDLGHVIDRENAAIGVFVTLENPTKPMLEEASGKGFYTSPGWHKDYPRLQILTVEDILNGKQPNIPHDYVQTFARAEKDGEGEIDHKDQIGLFGG